MRKFLGSVAAALGVVATAAVAQAEVVTRLVSIDPAFTLSGVYMGSVLHHDNAFMLYMTNALRRYSWVGEPPRLVDTVTSSSGCGTNPQLNFDERCGDQVGLFWKRVICDPLGDPDEPCERNTRWNAYPGRNNLTSYPAHGVWPPVADFQHLINYQTVNYVFPSPPRHGKEFDCHRDNLTTLATAATAPKVVYHPDLKRYFMAFNENINSTAPGQWWTGDDKWRVLWATSEDGTNWTIFPQILFQSTEESEIEYCGGGLMVDALLVENDYFYLVVTSIAHRKLYLLRAPVSPHEPSGFDSLDWELASKELTATGEYVWVPIPIGSQEDFVKNGYELMPDGGYPQFYQKQAAIARVFHDFTPNSRSLYVGITNKGFYATGQANDHHLQTWVTDSLSKPFVYQSRIDASVPGGRIEPGIYGWYVAFTTYPDNTPETPRIAARLFDLWLTGQNSQARLVTYRVYARLTGTADPVRRVQDEE